jgi:sugar phosphate isomerase/epimerase
MVMKNALSRRQFLKTSSLGLAGAAAFPAWSGAVEPFRRNGPSRLRLSLAAYSLRDYFQDVNHARQSDAAPEKRIDLFQFMDFCAEHGCEGTELTSYYFPAHFEREFLLKIRRHAFLQGLAISGTAIGNSFTHEAGPKRDAEMALVKKWIDDAAVMGAPHIRVFAGGQPAGASREEAKRRCIEALEESAHYAGQAGIFLGLENHGGIVAESRDILDIIRAVQSPWVGINLDTGNFHTEDPYADLAACAPYAVNVQVKAEIHRRGKPGPEPSDLPRVAQILRQANYQGYVALEYESAENPWTAIPKLLAELKKLTG